MEFTYHDLQFEQVPITMHSSGGTQYTRWVDIGMPKIPVESTNCVFYLYKSRLDALSGAESGGTGFLVGVSSEKYPHNVVYIYGITNYHVAISDGYSVIRLNKQDGSVDVIDYDILEWEWEKGMGDVAISPILNIDFELHKIIFVPTKMFATDQIIEDYKIGVGDDVFMVGRFMNYDGKTTNKPSVRFGNISLMPVPIKEERNRGKGKSYCLDLHSRPGYSGSPVFVYRTIGSDFDSINKQGAALFDGIYPFLCLLGIHWGQFPETWEDSRGNYIKGLSGMTCVTPAQRIMDLLNIPNLKKKREIADMQWEKKFLKEGFPAEPESLSIQKPISDNPQHKEDFTSLLNAATKKKPQDD